MDKGGGGVGGRETESGYEGGGGERERQTEEWGGTGEPGIEGRTRVEKGGGGGGGRQRMRNRWSVSELGFYAQSTIAVISGRWRETEEWKDKGGGGGGEEQTGECWGGGGEQTGECWGGGGGRRKTFTT